MDGMIYYSGANGVRCVNLNTLEDRVVLSWDEVEIDLQGHGLLPIIINENQLIAYGSRMTETNTLVSEWYRLTRVKKEKNEESERAQIVIAGVDIENLPVLKSAVKQFNSSNKKYEIVVHDYREEIDDKRRITKPVTYADYMQDTMQFNLQLIADGGVDIFLDYGFLNFPILEESGILADLNTFIENDKDFKKEEYLDLMFSDTTKNGELYYSSLYFYLEGILIMKENAPQKTEGWTLEEMQDMLALLPDNVEPFYPISPDDMLASFLQVTQPDLIDMTTNTANFHSDYFYQLLNFCKKYATQQVDGEFEYSQLMNGEILMGMQSRGDISDIHSWIEKKGKIGENVTIIGFPAKERSHIKCFPHYPFAIAEGKNKAISWEFIKLLLSTDVSGDIFSVKKEFLDKRFQEVINRADENGFVSFRDEKTSVDSIYELREIIENLSIVPKRDDRIIDIIREEADAYFSGQKTVEVVAAIIQDRVQTKLNEQG